MRSLIVYSSIAQLLHLLCRQVRPRVPVRPFANTRPEDACPLPIHWSSAHLPSTIMSVTMCLHRASSVMPSSLFASGPPYFGSPNPSAGVNKPVPDSWDISITRLRGKGLFQCFWTNFLWFLNLPDWFSKTNWLSLATSNSPRGKIIYQWCCRSVHRQSVKVLRGYRWIWLSYKIINWRPFAHTINWHELYIPIYL